MRKFTIIFILVLLASILTTFNPNNLNIGLDLFKINKIEIKNLKVLDKKKIKNLLNKEFSKSNLFVLDKNKIDKIANDNALIDYIEFKKIYPSKLQVIIYEKETIAIINYKQNKFYLTKGGEEIEYFKNPILEKLPNIYGKQKNFLEIYSTIIQLNFPISKVKSFYYFEIGRWDIILEDDKVIKLPVEDFVASLKNFMKLYEKINYEKYSIFDYRVKDQLILN
tara:strand:- start:1010 stop:1678 length:669 start_codon:yes stop_codon:yes gene_type:complete